MARPLDDLSGRLGIGGGIIIVPCLVFLFGLSQHAAQGTPLVIFDRCDLPVCGLSGGVCGQAAPRVRKIGSGAWSYLGAFVSWDGRVRTPSAGGDCWQLVPAAAGASGAQASSSIQAGVGSFRAR